tara:strand:- start:708 stop:905 length:198 start_codon:yes stop_codon:yes gene_type:complete
MIKVLKFMEKMWLMLCIVTFVIALYKTFQQSIYDALYFYGFSVVAIGLFLLRRRQRRLYEKNNPE